MRLTRLRLAGVALLPLTALALVAPSTQALASPSSTGVSRPGSMATLVAGPASTSQSVVGLDAGTASGAATLTTAKATFTVTYHGFSTASKASFQRAVNTWAASITSTVPITIDATYKPLAAGVLGSAGASVVQRDFTGAPTPGTWYVGALANKLHGSRLDTQPDIMANFSSSFDNWYFGTGAAPLNTYDFQSVVTHEIGHGLGFLGFGRLITASTASVSYSGAPTAYDRFTENGAGKAMTAFPDSSAALKAQLTGGSLFFDSAKVRSANSGKTAKLYAPSPFQSGSSYSHLDEKTYAQGTVNSLMTPQLSDGETIRKPGPITLALFHTIGW